MEATDNPDKYEERRKKFLNGITNILLNLHQEKPEKEKKTEFDRLIEKRMQDEMDKPKFNLFPAWSEDEYILASNLWKIFKSNAGTSGKKMAIEEIRKYILKIPNPPKA